jgi:hypothetical protein
MKNIQHSKLNPLIRVVFLVSQPKTFIVGENPRSLESSKNYHEIQEES